MALASPTPPKTPKLGSTGVITGLITSRFESCDQEKSQVPMKHSCSHTGVFVHQNAELGYEVPLALFLISCWPGKFLDGQFLDT